MRFLDDRVNILYWGFVKTSNSIYRPYGGALGGP